MGAKTKLNPASPVPFYHQIAEALRSEIKAGDLAPGDALEPMRRAAEAWGVHLHTVRHAYAALAREGLVELKRGPSGTRVLGTVEDTSKAESLESFLCRIEAEALDNHGLPTTELAAALTGRVTSQADRPPTVYVVECSDWQCRCHAREIESRFHVEARIWPLSRLSEPPEGAVISTYFHYNDIRKLWPRRLKEVRFITIDPDPALVEKLAGSRRLVVFERDPSTAEAVAADLVALFPGEAMEVETRVLTDFTSLSLGEKEDPPYLFAPRVWAELPPEVQQDPRSLELRYVFDRNELKDLGRALRWESKDQAAA